MATQIDAESVARLGDLKTAGWVATREQRVGDFLAIAAELRDACEAWRQKHLPKAREVFVVCDRELGQPLSLYRRTPSGRAVLVYEEA